VHFVGLYCIRRVVVVWGGYNRQILESNSKIKTIWKIVKLESDRKNINEEAQVLVLMVNLLTSHKLSQIHLMNTSSHWLRKKFINDDYYYDNGNDSSNNRDNNDNACTPVHHLLNVVNNSFPNVKLKSTTTWEIENSMKSFKPKNRHGYNESPTNVLKISSAYICSPLNHIFSTSLS